MNGVNKESRRYRDVKEVFPVIGILHRHLGKQIRKVSVAEGGETVRWGEGER